MALRRGFFEPRWKGLIMRFFILAIAVFCATGPASAASSGMDVEEGGVRVTFPAGFVRPVRETPPGSETSSVWMSAEPSRGWMALILVEDLPEGMNGKLAVRIAAASFLQGWGGDSAVTTLSDEEILVQGHCGIRVFVSKESPRAFARIEQVTAGRRQVTLAAQAAAQADLRAPEIEGFFSSLVLDRPSEPCRWDGTPSHTATSVSQTEEAAWTAAQQIRAIATATEAFATDQNRYPAAVDIRALKRALEPVYVRDLPVLDPWGTPYHYVSMIDQYRLVSAGADRTFEPRSRTIEAAGKGPSPDPGADLVFENATWKQYPKVLRPRIEADSRATQAEMQRILEDAGELESASPAAAWEPVPIEKLDLSAVTRLPPLESIRASLPALGSDWSSAEVKATAGKASSRTPVNEDSESTEWCIRRLALAVDDYYEDEGKLPATEDLAELFRVLGDDRLGSVSRQQSCGRGPEDIWGTPLVYRVSPDRRRYRLISPGSDRRLETASDLFSARVGGPLTDHARDVIYGDGMFLQWHVDRPEPGIEELRREAEGGDAEAQYELARRHSLAFGVPEDEAVALRWYLRAAEAGHMAAQEHLGTRYRFGDGVEPDEERALYWYGKAAAQGSSYAKEEIAQIRNP